MDSEDGKSVFNVFAEIFDVIIAVHVGNPTFAVIITLYPALGLHATSFTLSNPSTTIS